METTVIEHVQPAQARPAELSPIRVINFLDQLCESRLRVYNYYPNATHPEMWEAINEISSLLNMAKSAMSRKKKILLCLRSELAFHVIADRRTTKRFREYMFKVNTAMNACRDAVNYRSQL